MVVAVLVAGLGATPTSSDAALPAVTVYAHRGGSALAPENTLGAFRQAHALFADRGVWLEMDTQLTGDGHLVVIHDDTLDRTTDCTGTVIGTTLALLSSCNAAESFPGWADFEPVPTLRSVLEEGRTAGWRVMVEIKNIPLESNFDVLGTKVADALIGVVNATGFPRDRLIVQSFWPSSLDNIELKVPAIRTALLTAATLPVLPLPLLVTPNALYSTVRQYEISAPDIRTLDMLGPIVTIAHTLGRQVVTWTPNTAADITRAIGLGVDGVISDQPDLVYELLDG